MAVYCDADNTERIKAFFDSTDFLNVTAGGAYDYSSLGLKCVVGEHPITQ